jgi:hypothetical protein
MWNETHHLVLCVSTFCPYRVGCGRIFRYTFIEVCREQRYSASISLRYLIEDQPVSCCDVISHLPSGRPEE